MCEHHHKQDYTTLKETCTLTIDLLFQFMVVPDSRMSMLAPSMSQKDRWAWLYMCPCFLQFLLCWEDSSIPLHGCWLQFQSAVVIPRFIICNSRCLSVQHRDTALQSLQVTLVQQTYRHSPCWHFLILTRVMDDIWGDITWVSQLCKQFSQLVFLRSMRRLLVTASVFPSSPILVTPMKEALSSSETSVLTRATRRNIPEDTIPQFSQLHPLVSMHYITISDVTNLSDHREHMTLMWPLSDS
jgi:hypothetical protein